MTIRSRAVSALLRFVLICVHLFPSQWIPACARIFAFLAPLLLRRDRDLIASNLQRVYQLPAFSSFAQDFQRQVFRSQFTVLLETLKTSLATQDPNQIEGLAELGQVVQELTRSGRGLIVVTAHLGSWEFVARYTAQASAQVFYALAKPSKLPEMTLLMDRLRARMNTVILWTDQKQLLREMLKILKNGSCLGFVMDQKPEARIGPLVEFLGQTTEFVSGPAKLSIRQGSPVLAVFCMRIGPQRYRIIHEVIAGADHGQVDEILLTQKMATAIEKVIRLFPEQWLWNYKRWRSPPHLG